MAPKKSKPQHKVTKRASTSKKQKKPTPQPSIIDSSSSSPVYFWRETEPSTGYLSQWYPCAFTDDTDPSIVYKTAEHYMMHRKALLFSAPPSLAAEILATPHPRGVKALGRTIPNFSDTVWHAHRCEVVRRGNLLKFTRPVDEGDGFWFMGGDGDGVEDGEGAGGEGEGGGAARKSLREMLLATGEREIVEASPMDRIWGIGFGAARAATVGRERWGLNLLGKALVEVRGILRERETEGENGEGVAEEVAGEKVEEKNKDQEEEV